ncbi:MAG: hypothetical protein V7K50_24495 [Nostoc sp.]|uniref:hypothetical protein n=1 Tax=Nostoc sp. TaxID=1180 RepID=UPI002FF478AD
MHLVQLFFTLFYRCHQIAIAFSEYWGLGTCTERLVPSISTSLDGAGAEVSRSIGDWLFSSSSSSPSSHLTKFNNYGFGIVSEYVKVNDTKT